METKQIIQNTINKLNLALDHFKDDLTKIRTGRANPGVLDKLVVKAYQTEMPLNQLANVTAPEAQLLQITPYDSTNIQAISQAVRDDQNLGLNPVDDGIVIRISVPPLTTERREAIVKQLSDISEKCMITMRGIRHESLKSLETEKKSKSISEDDFSRASKQVDALMAEFKIKVEQSANEKEKEVMTI
jgi:ribosome recycling factor